MPRAPKIRVQYTRDAQFLMRLKQAVEKDPRPPKWKQDVIERLDQLAVLLIQAPEKLPEKRLKRKAQ